ncbi:hypothetical protein [Priestia megaterium]|uniref:hypothetical protein n=1 Tax=Priestia megaterium TaxID=1404 RepID=UPI001C452D89|nr:hypothetical protein [Priestia megaterium]MBV6734529.1 hypothetical protein [Priestia megaterium]
MSRKAKLNKEQVKEVIYLFKTKKNVSGLISYRDIYLFNKELVENNKFPVAMGEDFWRKKGRLGREYIDEANKVLSNQLITLEEKEITIPNVTDLTHKYYSNKEKLISYLIPLERQLYSSIEKELHFKKKITVIQTELENKKEKIKELENKVITLQDTLFKMLRYSNDKNTPIRDQLNTGKDKTQRVQKALEDIFSTPTAFYTWYEDKKGYETNSENKIINIKHRKTLAEEYNELI